MLLGFLPFLLPTGNGRRCCPQQFVSLRCRQEAGRRRDGLLLPRRDHLARAWAEEAIAAAGIETERGQGDLQALAVRALQAQRSFSRFGVRFGLGFGSRFLALRLCLRLIGLPLACRFRLSLALVFLRGLPPRGCLGLCLGARIGFRPLPFGLCLGERLVGLPLGLGIGGSFFRGLLLGLA